MCCHDFPDNDCWAGTGKADSGDDWGRCYSIGNYLWLEDDSAAANFLINLHFTQNNICISVAGSSCEVGKGTSKILNPQVSFRWGNEQISSASSWATQATSYAIMSSTVAKWSPPGWRRSGSGAAQVTEWAWCREYQFPLRWWAAVLVEKIAMRGVEPGSFVSVSDRSCKR